MKNYRENSRLQLMLSSSKEDFFFFLWKTDGSGTNYFIPELLWELVSLRFTLVPSVKALGSPLRASATTAPPPWQDGTPKLHVSSTSSGPGHTSDSANAWTGKVAPNAGPILGGCPLSGILAPQILAALQTSMLWNWYPLPLPDYLAVLHEGWSEIS